MLKRLTDLTSLIILTAAVLTGCSSGSSPSTQVATEAESDTELTVGTAGTDSTGVTTTTNSNGVTELTEVPDTTDAEEVTNSTDAIHTTNDTQDDSSEQDDDAKADTVLNANNANAAILQAFEVLSGRAYDRRLTAYPYVKQAPSLTPEFNALGLHFYYEILDCDNSGEKIQSNYDTGTDFDKLTVYDTSYSNCSVRSEILNGNVKLTGEKCCGLDYKKEFSNDFSVSFNSDAKMQLSGTYEYTPTYRLSVDNFNYYFSYPGGTLSIENATTSRITGNRYGEGDQFNQSTMSGSFLMSAPVLENQPVEVTIDNEFVNDQAPPTQLAYNRGSMRITAADSEIILVANNDNSNTVSVTVTSGNKSITTTEPWSTWIQALSFIPPVLGQDVTRLSANGNGTTISQKSYKTILTEVFNVMTGDRFGSAMLNLPDFPYPSFPFEEMAIVWGYGTEKNQTCENGGNANLIPYRWGDRQTTNGWLSKFDNCNSNNKTYHGEIEFRDYGTKVYFSNGFSVLTEDGSSTFKGRLHYQYWPDRDSSPVRIYSLKNIYFESTSTNDSFVLSDANFSFFAPDNRWFEHAFNWHKVMAGGFSLSSNATGQNTIEVQFVDPLQFARSEYNAYNEVVGFDEGFLRIDAGSGNQLWLNANNDDRETFTVQIFQPGEPPLTITERWQNWNALFEYNFDLHER